MKKSLVLAMAMALGVTASAYAANPFSDVPAGHWAYDSISKLAAQGVIEGYGDGTFLGDKLMTRYEMAQIVAKAMANGANVDKLAAEFADELNNLGVRVAALEKKADNVKITGRARFQGKTFHGTKTTNDWNRLRTDLTISGKINKDWTYTGLARIQQRLDDGNKNKAESGVDYQRAYVNGRIGGLKVQAGRYNLTLSDGLVYDARGTGIEAKYGKKIALTAGYATLDDTGYAEANGTQKTTYAIAETKVGKAAAVKVAYYALENYNGGIDDDILTAKLAVGLGKNIKAAYTFMKAGEKDGVGSDKGHVIAVNYKGANKAKPGTFGLEAIHYDQAANTYLSTWHTMDGKIPGNAGFQGWKVGADYTLAKNIVATVAWYDLKGSAAAGHTGTLFGDLSFFF